MAGMIELNNSLHTQFARAQAFLPKQVLAVLGILKFLLEEFLNWFTRPVEVMLHKNFGVRGHGLFFTLQICVTGLYTCRVFADLDWPLAVFAFASAALAVYHHVEAVRSEIRGVMRHSWSSGEPIPIWAWAVRAVQGFGFDPSRFVTVSWICRFYEPILVLAIGYSILKLVSPFLGVYLIGCSVALFIKSLIVHNRMLNMKRDQIDARIMSQWIGSIHKAASGQQQGEAQYFVAMLAEVPVPKREEDNEAGETATLPEKPSVAVNTTAVVADDRVHFNCRQCNAPIHVLRKYSGRKGKCKKCGAVMVAAAV
jgi:hypothetical protein